MVVASFIVAGRSECVLWQLPVLSFLGLVVCLWGSASLNDFSGVVCMSAANVIRS